MVRGECSKTCQVRMGETEWPQGGTGPKSGVGTTDRARPTKAKLGEGAPGRRQTAADCCGFQTAHAPSERRAAPRPQLVAGIYQCQTPDFFRDARNLDFYVKSPLLKANNQINFRSTVSKQSMSTGRSFLQVGSYGVFLVKE